MAAELIASHADADVYHADWRELISVLTERGGCDALFVDAPYSERTHAGHDAGSTAVSPDNWARERGLKDLRANLRTLNYGCWTPDEVRAFVHAWAPLVRGWMVSITDHTLGGVWQRAMEEAGRYAFAPLACVEPGSRLRMLGDGPSNWSCWAYASRPRDGEWLSAWREARRADGENTSLPGAYVVPPGLGEQQRVGETVVGGKPLWLMESIVRDYSRAGDLVVDPCCGAGTTLLAAQRNGRRAIGGDISLEHAELTAKRINRPAQQPLFFGGG